MSSIVDLNNLPLPTPIATPVPLHLPFEEQYTHTPSALLGAWGLLVAQTTVYALVAWVVLRRRRVA